MASDLSRNSDFQHDEFFPPNSPYEEVEKVEVGGPISEFEPVEKQRHFGILRYTVNNRFRKIMLIGIVNVLLIIGVILLIVFLVVKTGKNDISLPTTTTTKRTSASFTTTKPVTVTGSSSTKFSVPTTTALATTAANNTIITITTTSETTTTSYVPPPTYLDRYCGQDISNLWLDVVLVVDKSNNMTDDGLKNVATSINQVFGAGTRVGTNSSEPRTTRVGLITYGFNATVNADLDKYQSVGDMNSGVSEALESVTDYEEAYLMLGLTAASKLFSTDGSSRSHYKKVIIIYASMENGQGELDPIPLASRLQGAGITIITVACGNDTSLDNLKDISSPNYNFAILDSYLNLKIQSALLETNCFCPVNWIQYRFDFSDPSSFQYGTCIQPVNQQNDWETARLNCHEFGSYMATEFNQHKHDFIYGTVQNTHGFSQPFNYFIGLHLSNNKWIWDQPDGHPQFEVQWLDWLDGYPVVSPSMTACEVTRNGEGWRNVPSKDFLSNYVCEMNACDTDNYCAE